jgi:hypothetical protein
MDKYIPQKGIYKIMYMRDLNLILKYHFSNAHSILYDDININNTS